MAAGGGKHSGGRCAQETEALRRQRETHQRIRPTPTSPECLATRSRLGLPRGKDFDSQPGQGQPLWKCTVFLEFRRHFGASGKVFQLQGFPEGGGTQPQHRQSTNQHHGLSCRSVCPARALPSPCFLSALSWRGVPIPWRRDCTPARTSMTQTAHTTATAEMSENRRNARSLSRAWALQVERAGLVHSSAPACRLPSLGRQHAPASWRRAAAYWRASRG